MHTQVHVQASWGQMWHSRVYVGDGICWLGCQYAGTQAVDLIRLRPVIMAWLFLAVWGVS